MERERGNWYSVTDGMRDVVLQAAGNRSVFADLKSLGKASDHELIELDQNELARLTVKGAAYLVDMELLGRIPEGRRRAVEQMARRFR